MSVPFSFFRLLFIAVTPVIHRGFLAENRSLALFTSNRAPPASLPSHLDLFQARAPGNEKEKCTEMRVLRSMFRTTVPVR
jgi:hypothetical protein